MKFLKSQNTSRYSPSDNTIRVNPYGRGVMDFNGGIVLPKGTTAERPQLTGVRQPTDANGTIRYNTDLNEIEAYVGGNWETVRAAGANTISIETFGPGDATETVFGPLANVPASAKNVIVLVENVMQIPTTNYTLEQSDGTLASLSGPNAPYAAGWYLKFTQEVPFDKNVTVFFGFAN